MKKLNFFKIAFLSLFVFTLSCDNEDDKQIKYEGESLLHFVKDSQAISVINGGDNVDVVVEYSTTAPVSSSHNVSLVLDEDKSTAVLNQDFIILDEDQISQGEVKGSVTVRFLSSTDTPVSVAVFKLQSSSLNKAIFRQEFKITSTLSCPIPSGSFLGNYMIEQITPNNPDDGGSAVFNPQIVNIISTGTGQRQFSAIYLEGLNIGQPASIVPFSLVCGKTILGNGIDTFLNCAAGPTITLGPGNVTGNYLPLNDQEFTLTMTEYVTDGGCGSAPYQVVFKLTKQ